jgi:hypothetical protein
MDLANALLLTINARDNASVVIDKVAANASLAGKQLETTSVGLGKVASSMETIGTKMTAAITLPIAALIGVSAKMAYDFQNKMELLHTNAGIAQDAIAGLSDQVLKMAGDVGQAPDQMAAGLYHIASAGNGIWNTAQQMDILKVAAEGANLGLANLDDTTYSLTSAMASGVQGAKDATQMMATLNAIVGAGDMKMNDLNGALSTGILSTGATAGTSIQSIGAALATLTDNGEHADEAATRLRMTMSLMVSPSSMAAKQLEALGLTVEDAKKSTEGMNAVFAKSGLTTTKLADDLRQPNGISVAVKDLKKHLEDAGLSGDEAGAMLAKAFGGGRTDAALLTLLQNTDRMDAKFQAINNDAGEFQQKLNDLDNTPAQKLRLAWSSIQADLVKVGSEALPAIAQAFGVVSDAVKGAFEWWDKLDSSSKTALEYVVGTLAIGGPILLGFGKMINAIKDVHDAFKTLGTAADAVNSKVASVASDVIGNVGKVSGSFVKTTASAIAEGAKTAAAWVASSAKSLAAWVVDAVPKIIDAFSWTAIKSYVHAADVALAWSINAVRVSFIWTTQELPKIVLGFIRTSAAATVHAAATAVAWVGASSKAAFAWVTTELPRIVYGFISTSVAAVAHAGATAAAWVASSSQSAVAWVVTQLPRIVAAFVVTSASAVVNAAIASGAWVAAAVTSSESFGALSALVATPMVMPAIVIAAALGAIDAVYQKAQETMRIVNQTSDIIDAANKDNATTSVSAMKTLKTQHDSGQITDAQYRQKMALFSNALGTNYSQGGMTLVGENGPEIVNMPRGASVFTTQESQKMMGGGVRK